MRRGRDPLSVQGVQILRGRDLDAASQGQVERVGEELGRDMRSAKDCAVY